MFQFLTAEYLVYDTKTKLYNGQYKIVDSDFECSIIERKSVGPSANLIINVYKERNLNVAANLALYFKWCSKTYY